MPADAANEETIAALVSRVIKEEGHLDFFFANAGIVAGKPKLSKEENEASLQTEIQHGLRRVQEIPGDEFMEVMRVNALK
jgi:NAD(P)-dependent dehydrogenase (short-subunit alcohol dehydrogenase family)